MAGPTPIDLNPFDLNYCPFMISLDKCGGSCHVVDDLQKRVFSSKQKTYILKYFIWKQERMKQKRW